MENDIKKTREFVKNSFIKNPHYSFDHWSVMYNHSIKVENIALKIAKEIECDKKLVVLGALLHDIGKTHKVDTHTLHYNHEDFNLKVSKKFIKSLDLPVDTAKEFEDIVSYNSHSVEAKIIKDADALALYADKRLYMLFLVWAIENKLFSSIQRKIDKWGKLNFDVSKKIGKKWYRQMCSDWKGYVKKYVSEVSGLEKIKIWI